MSTKVKNIVSIILTGAFMFGFFVWCVLKPQQEISESERRPLASFPTISASNIVSGKFMQDFEKYSTDQFPLRDTFRKIKALFSYNVWRQKDNNGIYLSGDFASKLEYPLNEDSLDNAAKKFRRIYDKYLDGKDVNVYLSIVPDKNCFMAQANGYPAIDYKKLAAYLCEKTDYMKYIDIFPLLELDDYYKTDTHWRQEKILDVAERLASEMGADVSAQYEQVKLDKAFHGVYFGQSALSLPAETIYYMTNETLESCIVDDLETDSRIPVYDLSKADGNDVYEIFLSGSKSLLNIKNPNAENDKKLIIFRDSFGSSLAPLLLQGYSRVTVVDIRYLSSEILDRMMDFDAQDVLFVFSTLVLNNSVTLK